jgi:hypothetical protein
MSEDKLILAQELVDSALNSLKTARNILAQTTGVQDVSREKFALQAMSSVSRSVSGRVMEGVFDGQNMVDNSGKTYPVPANYASKSKLVEGDVMKLTITEEGKFIYKQIGPVERRTVLGVLIQEDGQYKVLAEGKTYRVLLASVTFYRAEVGDQVTVILPRTGEAHWVAMEAVVPKDIAEKAASVASLGGRDAKGRGARDDDGELVPDLL